MIPISVWAWVFVSLSSLGTLLVFVFRKPLDDNRFGPLPRKMSLLATALSGFARALDLSGRSSRGEFLVFLPVALIVAVLSWAVPTYALYTLLFNAQIQELQPVYFYLWPGVIAVWTGFISLSIIAMTVRRLHDINRSGWWVLIGAGVGIVVLLYWLTRPSQQKSTPRNLELGVPLAQMGR